MRRWLAAALFACFAHAAQAIGFEDPLPDPAKEAQARAMFHELRCVVCQGQPISESNATLAQDMRAFIRQKLSEGQSPEAIERFLVERYGRDILLNPPKEGDTALLWLMPFGVLLLGLLVSRRYVKTKV